MVIKIYFYFSLTLYSFTVLFCEGGAWFIDNFTQTGNVLNQWFEHSDTIIDVGKSKASFVHYENLNEKRAVLFTLLNPQPCGAGFAGIMKNVSYDLADYKIIQIKLRGQGQYKGYKFILKQSTSNYFFCNLFEAPKDFAVITLQLNQFKPYHDGNLIQAPNNILDLSKIVSVGIQAYAGKYLQRKQAGVASLEIDWIRIEN